MLHNTINYINSKQLCILLSLIDILRAISAYFSGENSCIWDEDSTGFQDLRTIFPQSLSRLLKMSLLILPYIPQYSNSLDKPSLSFHTCKPVPFCILVWQLYELAIITTVIDHWFPTCLSTAPDGHWSLGWWLETSGLESLFLILCFYQQVCTECP